MNPATPADLGFAMPAEWEPHEATWLGWPHCRTDWPGKLAAIEWVYGEIVRKIAEGEKVRIIIDSASREARARRILARAHANLANVEFFRAPSDRGWSRSRAAASTSTAAAPCSPPRSASSIRRPSAAIPA